MISRYNQILIAVLVVQIALGVAVFWPRPAASGSSGPLLPNFKAAEVVELTLSDAEGSQIHLTKQGDNWVMAEADDYPADSSKITPFLEKLEKIQTNRQVTQTEASHRRLKVANDEFDRLIEVKLKDGTTHQLYVGTTAGASATHVRAGDQPAVYLTGEIASWDASAQASGWIDTLYFTVPQTATVALTLENKQGAFEFEKEGETWSMAGLAEDETFSESNFTALLNQATSMTMLNPVGKAEQDSFGLAEPQATVTLKDDQGKTYTLAIGAQEAEDKSYFVKFSGSPYYIRVAEFTGSTFATKTRDNFLQPPPTAAPTTEAGASSSQ